MCLSPSPKKDPKKEYYDEGDTLTFKCPGTYDQHYTIECTEHGSWLTTKECGGHPSKPHKMLESKPNDHYRPSPKPSHGHPERPMHPPTHKPMHPPTHRPHDHDHDHDHDRDHDHDHDSYETPMPKDYPKGERNYPNQAMNYPGSSPQHHIINPYPSTKKTMPPSTKPQIIPPANVVTPYTRPPRPPVPPVPTPSKNPLHCPFILIKDYAPNIVLLPSTNPHDVKVESGRQLYLRCPTSGLPFPALCYNGLFYWRSGVCPLYLYGKR